MGLQTPLSTLPFSFPQVFNAYESLLGVDSFTAWTFPSQGVTAGGRGRYDSVQSTESLQQLIFRSSFVMWKSSQVNRPRSLRPFNLLFPGRNLGYYGPGPLLASVIKSPWQKTQGHCVSLRATVTNYHTVGVLKQHRSVLSEFWRLDV